MGRNRSTFRLTCGVIAGVLALCWVSSVRSAPDGDLQSLRRLAERLQAQSRWERACDLYAELIARDPGDPKTLARYLTCRRHVLLARRYRDPSVRDLILNQDASALLPMYREVLEKLRGNYADEQKSRLSGLFQGGLDQLRLALSDDFFRRTFLPGVTADSIRDFDSRLARIRTGSAVRDMREARAKALEISVAARDSLRLKPAVTILELAVGACAGLDEHTTFLTPTELRDIAGGTATDAPTVQAQLLDVQKAVGYIHIASFERSSPQELDEAILHLRAEGIRALIIDLRDNPGGSLEAAVQVVERFIPDGVIVCTQSRVGQYSRTYRAHNNSAWAIPLVVLTNPGTASAAEVAAGAWKEHQRATLVGEPTFGKACIQGTLPLDTVPAGIRLTIARFFSPRGKSYTGSGVTPHILVPQPQQSLHDQQLEAALQEATRHTDTAQ